MLRSPHSRPRWSSPPDNSTADEVPPSDGSLDVEEESEGTGSGFDLAGQGQPCSYASALCEGREDTFEFEEEALRELEDSLQQIQHAKEEEALGELEDVLRLVREATDKGTDNILTSARQEELFKQLQDLDITWRCEGADAEQVKIKGLSVLPALLGSKGFLRRRQRPPIQEEQMQLESRNTRKGAQGTAKCQQRQKVKTKRCTDDVRARPETGDLHWPEMHSRINVEEEQVLSKPGMCPSSLFCCAV